MSSVLHENLMEPMEIIKEVEKTILKNWTDQYENTCVHKGAHLASITNFKPAVEPWFKNVRMTSKCIKTICRLMTGHGYNDSTLCLMGKIESRQCNEIDSNDHILFICRGYSEYRKKYKILAEFKNSEDMFKNINVDQYRNIYNFLIEVDRNI